MDLGEIARKFNLDNYSILLIQGEIEPSKVSADINEYKGVKPFSFVRKRLPIGTVIRCYNYSVEAFDEPVFVVGENGVLYRAFSDEIEQIKCSELNKGNGWEFLGVNYLAFPIDLARNYIDRGLLKLPSFAHH